jgi:TetR/AcrR family transcriptional regulator, transcriptional repressor for nem operon
MPRQPEFIREHAVDAALKLFWRRGYSATSLPDLLQAMGIARSSFYGSFSDKRSLYIECLELFGDRTRAILTDAAGNGNGLAAITAFFDATVLAAPNHRLTRGCMMVNTVLELADVDPELQALGRRKLDQVQEEFERLLQNAIDHGDLNIKPTASELAEVLMTLNLGLRVQSRKQPDRAKLNQTINTSLAMMGLAA